MFAAQLKNELWKLFGKKRTYIGFGVFVIAQLLMLLMFKYTRWQSDFERLLSNNGYLAADYISALTVGLIMLIPQLGLLMPLYVALIGGDLVAKESEDGTLRMILSRPISRLRLLVVKWLAGAVYTAALVVALGVIALVFARLYFPWKGMFVFFQPPPEVDTASVRRVFSLFGPGEGFKLYVLAHGFIVLNIITLMSVAFMFSCFNMKPAAATILALSYLFANTVVQNIPFFARYQSWFITYHLQCWFWVFQNPVPWAPILGSEIILLATNATAFIIGAVGFQMRDIKA